MARPLALVAGTFDFFHAGHKALLRAAAKPGNRVLAGLTTDEFARKNHVPLENSFEKRKKRLEAFLKSEKAEFEIFPLSSTFGPAASMPCRASLVASEETRKNAERINNARKKKGLPPLSLVILQLVLAQDLLPVSCKRIKQGKIDESGKRLKPIVLNVASENPAKLDGTASAASKLFFRAPVIVASGKARTSVSKQPFEKATLKGAEERARKAFSKECDYSIGLESGLFLLNGKHYDFLWACVFDGKEASFGCSMGFEVPEPLARLTKKGLDLSQAFEKLAGEKNVGRDGGVLSRISGGLAHRAQMAEQAVLMAFVPRVAKSKFTVKK